MGRDNNKHCRADNRFYAAAHSLCVDDTHSCSRQRGAGYIVWRILQKEQMGGYRAVVPCKSGGTILPGKSCNRYCDGPGTGGKDHEPNVQLAPVYNRCSRRDFGFINIKDFNEYGQGYVTVSGQNTRFGVFLLLYIIVIN